MPMVDWLAIEDDGAPRPLVLEELIRCTADGASGPVSILPGDIVLPAGPMLGIPEADVARLNPRLSAYTIDDAPSGVLVVVCGDP